MIATLTLMGQIGGVFEDVPLPENLRHAVIGEHREGINVGELSEGFSGESSPDISDKNLCPLVEEDLETLVDGRISEPTKVSRYEVSELACAFVRAKDKLAGLSLEFIPQHGSYFSNQSDSFVDSKSRASERASKRTNERRSLVFRVFCFDLISKMLRAMEGGDYWLTAAIRFL